MFALHTCWLTGQYGRYQAEFGRNTYLLLSIINMRESFVDKEWKHALIGVYRVYFLIKSFLNVKYYV